MAILYVRPFVTLVDYSKTAQTRITKFSFRLHGRLSFRIRKAVP